MTEKTEYKEIVFWFMTEKITFPHSDDLWMSLKKSLEEDKVISFQNYLFTRDTLQFVERR